MLFAISWAPGHNRKSCMSMVGGVCPRFACSFTSVSSVAGNYKYTEIKTDKYANKELYIYRKLLMQIGNNSVIPFVTALG